ncbi:response regulator transcription factor [Candidatus Enterococcus ferrettii]|uniref:DNA-binding response regulator n=1 Tax=Candidatus Enterococcus ferrettii TaxID=2815324 RepID=A0ABV0EU53_9ENTE|nr:response regulator transcription factor [Enterococcus sp. 665A]MBO1341968.1 response regulator transcription factor [Enterococcus sp. 665A]
MRRILLLEDDKNLNRGINLCLTKEGYEVVSCLDVASAKAVFEQNEIDLIISDISLPDGSGLDFCQEIRRQSGVRIVMLTSYNQEYDIVAGYEHGADDYVTKPFSLMVLVSKINALVKRIAEPNGQRLISNELSLSLSEMKAVKNNETLLLSKTELQLLTIFMKNPKQILSVDQLLEQIWDTKGDYIDSNIVSVNISRLRQKIGKEKIKTVRGVGYLWVSDVQK